MAYPLAVRRDSGRWAAEGVPEPAPPRPERPSDRIENRIERLHETEKERTKVVRAFDPDRGVALSQRLVQQFRLRFAWWSRRYGPAGTRTGQPSCGWVKVFGHPDENCREAVRVHVALYFK